MFRIIDIFIGDVLMLRDDNWSPKYLLAIQYAFGKNQRDDNWSPKDLLGIQSALFMVLGNKFK